MIDLRELIQKISQAKDKLELQNIKSQFLGKNSQINQEFKILREFDSAPCGDRSNLLNYFISSKLKTLTESIGEF